MSPEKKSDLFEGLVDREFSLDIDARLDETARKLIGESTLSPRNLQTLAAKVALMAGDDFKGTFTVTDELILQAAEELGINLE